MRKDFERKKGYKNTPRRVKSSKETFAQAFLRQCAAAGVDNFDKEGLTRRGFVPTHIEAAFAIAGGFGARILPKEDLQRWADSYTANAAAILERLQR